MPRRWGRVVSRRLKKLKSSPMREKRCTKLKYRNKIPRSSYLKSKFVNLCWIKTKMGVNSWSTTTGWTNLLWAIVSRNKNHWAYNMTLDLIVPVMYAWITPIKTKEVEVRQNLGRLEVEALKSIRISKEPLQPREVTYILLFLSLTFQRSFLISLRNNKSTNWSNIKWSSWRMINEHIINDKYIRPIQFRL